jgi:hypothetical protein
LGIVATRCGRFGLADQVVGLGQQQAGPGQDLDTGRGRGEAAAGAVQQPDPSTRSRESEVRETAAWETPNSTVASVKLPVSTMATRQRSWRNLRSMILAYRTIDAIFAWITGPPYLGP